MIFGVRRPPFDPHATARNILADPRFRMYVQGQPRKTWWDVLTAWLGDRWNQLIDAFAHRVHVGANASIAAGDVILIAASILVLVVLVRLVAGYVREAPTIQGATLLCPHITAQALYAQSIQAANRGDYASAVALVFRAALAALDVRGVVHEDPSLTVNECRREVQRRAPRFVVPFDTIARAFTSAIYAEALATPTQWNAVRDAYDQISTGSAGAP